MQQNPPQQNLPQANTSDTENEPSIEAQQPLSRPDTGELKKGEDYRGKKSKSTKRLYIYFFISLIIVFLILGLYLIFSNAKNANQGEDAKSATPSPTAIPTLSTLDEIDECLTTYSNNLPSRYSYLEYIENDNSAIGFLDKVDKANLKVKFRGGNEFDLSGVERIQLDQYFDGSKEPYGYDLDYDINQVIQVIQPGDFLMLSKDDEGNIDVIQLGCDIFTNESD